VRSRLDSLARDEAVLALKLYQSIESCPDQSTLHVWARPSSLAVVWNLGRRGERRVRLTWATRIPLFTVHRSIVTFDSMESSVQQYSLRPSHRQKTFSNLKMTLHSAVKSSIVYGSRDSTQATSKTLFQEEQQQQQQQRYTVKAITRVVGRFNENDFSRWWFRGQQQLQSNGGSIVAGFCRSCYCCYSGGYCSGGGGGGESTANGGGSHRRRRRRRRRVNLGTCGILGYIDCCGQFS
jgi:hypothetical protein